MSLKPLGKITYETMQSPKSPTSSDELYLQEAIEVFPASCYFS